jgi:mercuric ion transport protein
MAGSIARTIFLGATWLFVICTVIQVFLAGLGVFDDPAAFITHRDFGYVFGWLIIVMLVAAIVGRMGRLFIGGSAVLIVLFALQSVFVAVRTDMPTVAALHPLNGFAILIVALILGRAAWLELRATA